LQQRRRITWIVTGGVAVLVIVAGVDALRPSDTETRPPAAEGSQTEPRTIGTVEQASDTDQEEAVGDSSTTPVDGVPAPKARVSRPFLLDLRAGEKTRLAKSLARGRNFAASPGGRRLAYVKTGAEGSPQIFVARIDGTRVRQITHDRRGAGWPAWSPDGTMIAYEEHASPTPAKVFVLDLASGASTQVVERAWESGLQFTPDGSSLIYTGGSRYPELRTVPIAGGRSTLVIDLDKGLADSGDGSFSPDGSRVTFLGSGFPTAAGHCGPCRLVANADGSQRRIVPGCYPSNPAGTWSPDGGRIVCLAGTGRGVVVVDMTTEVAARITGGSGAVWVDDDTLLIEP
jgi:Tol biopolymer transport system component